MSGLTATMSLSSFLLTKAKRRDAQAVDTELDELFKSKAYAAPPRVTAHTQKSGNDIGKKRKSADNDDREGSHKKARRKFKTRERINSESSDEDDSKEPENEDDKSENWDTDEGASSLDPSQLVHESLKSQKHAGNYQKTSSKKKYAPPEETAAQRDLRTVFVGNLSVEVAKKRPLQNQLRKHLLSSVPTAKIESMRFRSVAFQSPTARPPAEGDAPNPKAQGKEGREHDRTRAAAWRQSQEANEAKEGKDEKKFLTPNQKKKIAFINQEFHPVADTVHAYAIFAHPPPIVPSSEHAPHKDVMNPYEAAEMAARQCDGSMLMDRLLRVDVIGKSPAADLSTNPKSTIFVGNLDFASREEDLRVFFEGVITKERGPPPDLRSGEEEQARALKAQTWVTRLRIVRDRETQLGKGFAYVQFADRECVDEILAIEEAKLKFAKRKLRVQRCKTIPGSSVSTSRLTANTAQKSKTQSQSNSQAQSSKKPAKQGQSVKPPLPIAVPKGDPKLGEKLAHLPKGERKQAKAADADRVARRLAKKKARMAMGAKGKDSNSEGKKRVRARKKANDKAKNGKTGKGKEKKGRVRSEKSLAKLNTKK